MRAKYISNSESHFYYANSINGKVYQLFLNEYILFISSNNYPQIADFGFLSNIGIEKLKIGLLSESIWKELIVGVHDLIEKKMSKMEKKISYYRLKHQRESNFFGSNVLIFFSHRDIYYHFLT